MEEYKHQLYKWTVWNVQQISLHFSYQDRFNTALFNSMDQPRELVITNSQGKYLDQYLEDHSA